MVVVELACPILDVSFFSVLDVRSADIVNFLVGDCFGFVLSSLKYLKCYGHQDAFRETNHRMVHSGD